MWSSTVDDDRRVRESVQSVLESAGYEAVTFESAETFLLSGALSSVSCVIADVRLPGMDGTELQRGFDRNGVSRILITPMMTMTFANRHCEMAQSPSW